MKRFLTALVLVPFFLYIVLLAPGWLFVPVVACLGLLCFHEFLGIARAHYKSIEEMRFGPAPYLAGVIFLVTPAPEWLFAVIAVLAVMLLVLRQRDLAACLPVAASVALGLLYIFGSWRSAIGLRQMSVWWLLFATAINWVGDTFAYYVGHNFGRHKLAPRVSPGKSWEGTLASLASSLILGPVYLHYLLPQFPVAQGLVLCVAANVAGQMGDLAESAFKRGAGVKDRGTLLPGLILSPAGQCCENTERGGRHETRLHRGIPSIGVRKTVRAYRARDH